MGTDRRGRPGRLLGGTQEQENDFGDGERWLLWYPDDVAVVGELSTETLDADEALEHWRRITRE